MQVLEPGVVHPVVVIGSGASGGMAAWNLTRKGIGVVLLDAGEKFSRENLWTHLRPWQEQERRARGEKPRDLTLDGKEQPHLTTAGRPFDLTRGSGPGGQTNGWGPPSPRCP